MKKHITVWLQSRFKDWTEWYYECEKCWMNNWCDVHHIVSRRYQGTDVAENLIMLCRECHTWVHAHNNELEKALLVLIAQTSIIQPTLL